MNVKKDKLEEAIARKLVGFGTVGPLEQAKMIRRAVLVAKDHATEVKKQRDELARMVITGEVRT